MVVVEWAERLIVAVDLNAVSAGGVHNIDGISNDFKSGHGGMPPFPVLPKTALRGLLQLERGVGIELHQRFLLISAWPGILRPVEAVAVALAEINNDGGLLR